MPLKIGKTVKWKQLEILTVMYGERCERVFEKRFLEKHGFGRSHSSLLLKPENLPKVALKFCKLEFV